MNILILIPALLKEMECHTNCSKEKKNKGFKGKEYINENTIS